MPLANVSAPLEAGGWWLVVGKEWRQLPTCVDNFTGRRQVGVQLWGARGFRRVQGSTAVCPGAVPDRSRVNDLRRLCPPQGPGRVRLDDRRSSCPPQGARSLKIAGSGGPFATRFFLRRLPSRGPCGSHGWPQRRRPARHGSWCGAPDHFRLSNQGAPGGGA